ncbi:negative regulation of extrinsic apoptotic signaling pathway, variant 2 [Schistosoma haematobium]|uniref:Negative regulation of extrinsic apoptotic signaling pathway, variant 2 n=1 Tax=Schistosoma haematobium TaxID=6185 RepID=A0A094ZLT6_SCHHA|nr:negative regulation of extrinsic apoptotic signaling pathway, variant 2 [Schistosoma haematobium]KAH9592367.1 negative regulation of extrinsic apoptotic signaling pathway, variant 2 [Schistosoma haematobium]CAH8680234.1 unnamed protein product [Schistosoma haematobium]
MSVRRYTDPVYLQFVWNAIEACSRDSIESSFHELLSFIQRECDSRCTAGKLQNELSNAISDGCIECNQRCYVKRDPMPKVKDKHDWYCFECHGPGHVVSCPTCFRVYHPDCLPVALSSQLSSVIPCESGGSEADSNMSSGFPPTSPCPVCQRLSRASNISNPSTPSELHKIFQVVLDRIRNKVNWKTMQVVGYLNEPLRNNYLVLRQINTRLITERMRADPSSKDCYPNRTSLLIDVDLLIHNTAIFYGSKNDMSNMARQIRSQLERELRESSFCIDCYLRLHSASVNKLTAPCRVAHRLLWFQHNGWSFRPCKMLYESTEGYEVVCFGGRHERVFVPLARAFDMNFTADELGLRETPPLKKALNEAEEYKTNQAIFDQQMKNSDHLPNKMLAEPISIDSIRNNLISVSISNGTFLKSATSPPLKKKRPGRRPLSTRSHNEDFNVSPEMQVFKSRKSTGANSPVWCPVSQHSTSRRDSHWSDNMKNVTEDNLTSLSSLNSDSDGPETKCRISEPTPENPSVNKSSMKLSIPLLPTPTKRKSHKRKRCNEAHSRPSFSNGISAVPPSCDSSSSELSTASFAAKTQRTIRIKPLPFRSENNDIPLSVKETNQSLPRLTCVDSHVVRTEPVHSMSSSSSAASGPSSDRTTVPALASSGGHTPPDSSAFSASSTYSDFSKKSRGRPPKTHKSTKSSLPSASAKCATENSDDCSSTPLLLSARNTYEPPANNKHCLLTIPISSPIRSDRLTVADEDKQHPVCSLSPPSSLSDAESDLSSLSSSSSTVSSSSQLSSSSLSSTSTLSSPALRLSFSTLKPKINDELSTARVKQKSSKDILTPFQSQLTLKTRDNKEGTKEADSSQHVPKLTKSIKSSRHNLEMKGHFRPSSRSTVINTFKNTDLNNDYQDEDVGFCMVSPEKSLKPEKVTGILRIPGDGSNSVDNKSLGSSAPNSSVKNFAFDSPNTKLSSKTVHPSGWSSGTKILSTFNDQPSAAPQLTHPTGANVSTGPTPPSNSSASSSCYSSVSPAALSSTSGLGSSLSDPKSVDASPGEVATMLGNAPFSCSSGNGSGLVAHLQSDSNMIKTEERIHRIYADRLIALTTERDQAREEVHRRDILISELRRAHEAEIKRVKQRTWCQVCLNEAFYHCCPGTAYCSETCQFEHWTAQHNRDCRRRTESQQQQQIRS